MNVFEIKTFLQISLSKAGGHLYDNVRSACCVEKAWEDGEEVISRAKVRRLQIV